MRKLLSTPGFAWVSGLTTRTTTAPSDDSRFTDEEILTVVRAGEAGMKLADLCEATGISIATYYEWKARYGGLSPQQLHAQRQLTHVRRRRVAMLAGTVAVAAVAVGGLMLTRRSDAAAILPPVVPSPMAATAAAATPATPGSIPVATTAVAPPAPVAPAPVPPAPAAPASAPSTSAIAAPAPSPPAVAPSAPPTPDRGFVGDPSAYSVQIAAVPDLQQARVALEKLTTAGYPAHITTKTVNRVEMYRVRVGPLETRAAADQAAVRLKHDGYASPWVTR